MTGRTRIRRRGGGGVVRVLIMLAVLMVAGLMAVTLRSVASAASTPPPAVRHLIPPQTVASARPVRPIVASPAAPAVPPSSGSPLVVRRILDTGGPIRFGDWFWNEAGAPAGPIVITVDLTAETISAFRGGYEIGTAAIIYGGDGTDTPLGIFPILGKDADHVSNLYGAPMPYMLRLTNGGVSIHGAPINPSYATHGCIGVPKPFAKKLFGVTKIGDRVIVTDGRTMAMGQKIEA